MPTTVTEAPPNTLISLSQDSSEIAQNLSDLTTTPPKKKRDQDARRKSVEAKMRRKWQRNIQKEKAYERSKAEQAKQQEQQEEGNDSNCSSLVEISKDLMPISICHEASTESPPLEKMEGSKKQLDSSNSLAEPEEPALVTPDEKESHKVLDALDTSGNNHVYSAQEQEYFNFHKQLYAPQEEDYLDFLKDLELEQADPETQQKEFAAWLQGMEDKDIQPIPPDTSADDVPREKKRVAFSKETTVRFFSRTREELTQLRRRCKNIGRKNKSVPNDDSSDEEDWPLFKYLDDKLKEIEESNAWDDPMAAVTDMFVSKDLKEKMSPIMCVSCENQAENVNDVSADRSLADLDDDDELGAAKLLASTKAAAAGVDNAREQELSLLSQESSSGISALWFAVPYKSPSTSEGKDFIRPVVSPASDKSDSTKSSGDPDDQSAISSPPRLQREAPKSLSLIRTTEPVEETATAISSHSVDPDGPKKQSLSWLAEELDFDVGGTSVLPADALNTSVRSNGKNTTSSSLGRNTNSFLLRRVSEHLNASGESGKDSSSSPREAQSNSPPLNELFDPPGSTADTSSERRSVTVSVSELDKIFGKKNPRKSPASVEGRTSPKELSSNEKRRVVNGAKRWAASQKSNAKSDDRSNAVVSPSSGSQQRVMYVVSGAKRWTASQKAGPNKAKSERPGTPSLKEDGPDIDESREWDKDGNANLNTSHESSVWEGLANSPLTIQEGPDLDESKHDGDHPADEKEIVFNYAGTGDKVASVDSNPWLSSEDGPDMDEAKDWNVSFSENPDLTVTTSSVSQDHPSWDDGEDWVAFPSSEGAAPNLDEAWSATFPADERPQTSNAPIKSPRKQVRVSPSRSSRIKELASKFERKRTPSPRMDTVHSPLTPITPWADSNRKQEDPTEYPDLQQPVLDESRSGSDSSPVSVTHV